MNKENNYKISSSQFEQALTILNKEQQAKILNRHQKFFLNLLSISLLGLLISFYLVAIWQSDITDGIFGLFVIIFPISFFFKL